MTIQVVTRGTDNSGWVRAIRIKRLSNVANTAAFVACELTSQRATKHSRVHYVQDYVTINRAKENF